MEQAATSGGPLAGLRIIELVGQGPGPYGAALLADLGADVVAVDRPKAAGAEGLAASANTSFMRGKRGIAINLKDPAGIEDLLGLLDAADVFIDPFRPGVCERLGIGPEVVLTRNPRLIYARMTGFGQDGPMAHAAGHDINYISLSGALHTFGYEGQPPTMPINVLGDFAGGGLLMVMGIAAAAFERSISGKGQAIDISMVDGAAMILGPFFQAAATGVWGARGTNHLDGAAPFYNVYETADNKWVSVGAIEPQFHAELYERLGIDEPEQWDKNNWPAEKARLSNHFATGNRDAWCERLEGFETCFTPVLAPTEVAQHRHTAERGTVTEVAGMAQPQIAPRFGRTPGAVREPCLPGSSAVADIAASWSD